MEAGPSGVRKGAWTAEEDNLLRRCIEKHGEGKWHQVPSKAGLNRCRKSCRLRWLNYLKPSIKRERFSDDEVDLIIRLHRLLGNRWSLIAGRLPGRTANNVKNYWNTHMSKKQECCEIKTGTKKTNFPSKPAKGIDVIRPRPRSFSNNSRLWLKDQSGITFPSNSSSSSSNSNNICNNISTNNDGNNDSVYGTGNNNSNNNMCSKDSMIFKPNLRANQSGETMWWENLLEEGEERQGSWMNSDMSMFDADLWNLFNTENGSL